MIFTDYFALLALVPGLAFWWRRNAAHRSRWVITAALLAIALGAWSIFDDRWQAGMVILPAALMLLGLLAGRKRRRTGPPWISGTFLTLLGGVAVLAIYFFPVTHLPAPSGKHPVGVRDFELQDQSRPGLIAAGPQEPRRLLVRVWYPASDTENLVARQYFSDAEVDTTAESIGRFLNAPFAFKYLKHVRTNSYENAPMAAGLGEIPTVIYSHGYTSFAGQNTALMEELASHGYAVYSVQHSFDSGPTVFPNGDVLESDPLLLQEMRALANPSEAMKQGFVGPTFSARREGQLQAHEEAMASNQRIAARSARIWTEDRVFVLDQLQAGAVPESVKEIVAAGNFAHTGQIGMSFGGSTTGEFCYLDRRCAAGVNLDGADYHFTPFGQNEPVPFLMLYSDFRLIAQMISGDPEAKGYGFNDFSYERPETAGLRPDVVRLKVNSVSHLGVSDFSLFMRTPLRNPLFGSIDSEAMIRIQNDFVLGFFDKYVRHMNNDFPASQFAAHEDWVAQLDMAPLREDWLATHPQDRTVEIMLETSVGEILVALYPERAPVAVAQFLAHLEAGDYDGSSFYRTVRAADGSLYQSVQAGRPELRLPEPDPAAASSDPVSTAPVFASSSVTGIAYDAGALALLPPLPGSTVPELSFNTDAHRSRASSTAENSAATSDIPATIGRVLSGLPLLRQIHDRPTSAETGMEAVDSGYLQEPVIIHRIYRQ